MSGIYLHIPFCRQACHYCNFHFTTSIRYKSELLQSLLKEMELRKDYLRGEPVETIYFGGGTPSLLELDEISQQLKTLGEIFPVVVDAEITLEANPDDITEEKLRGWQKAGINRLSIGVQSFFEDDLKWMNRAHTASQAMENLKLSRQYFDNITIDLIYGTPCLTDEKWKHNVDTAIGMGIPHISCYALTVEPKTPLHKMIEQHRSESINQDKQSAQFILLMEWMQEAGLEHYEISNFARPGWRSRHNTSYWQGKSYLGLGPSAHSFDVISRQWNVANNNIYIASLEKGMLPFEREVLSPTQQLNEYIMTSLRTSGGLELDRLGEIASRKILIAAKKYVEGNLLKQEKNALILTREGKLLADGIAADLFFTT